MLDKKAVKMAKWLVMRLDGADVTFTLLNLENVMVARRDNFRRWEHACDVSDYLCDLTGYPGLR